ncbi:hypothetical protein niasHS_014797 [Heterodera schachtii]|uniref:Uncharacterized protein n=1 Tax=Heterodera schachtii TaxID=97005 RepID=A0ABD2IN82_HETSC
MNSPTNFNHFHSTTKCVPLENGFDREKGSTSNNNHKRRNDNVKSELIDNAIRSPKSNKRAFFSADCALNPTALAEMMPSSRLSMGMAGRLRDIVAIFPQNDLASPGKLLFREQMTNSDQRVFSAKGQADVPGMNAKEISFVGREEAAGEGFEYILAIVDRRTGRASEFKRTALINFQLSKERGVSDKEKSTKNVDYSADFTLSLEKKQEDRKRLTLDFGSVKKNKMLDARIRRSVTNETLEAMTSTAFSSVNFKAMGEGEENEANSEKKFSILEQAQSSVLPKANLSAAVPGEVYSLDQFVPELSEVHLRELQEEAMQFFRQNESVQKLVNLGISSVVAKRLGNPLRYGNPSRRCFLALKIVALAKLTQTIHKVNVKEIRKLSVKEVESLSFIPPKMLCHIREEFLSIPQNQKGRVFYELSAEKRSRVLAELLCLLLLFDDPEFTLPISPIVQDFYVSENVLKNLLVAMGCVVSVASETQALSLNTIRIARLVGPPDGKSASFMKKSNKQRRTN